MQSLLHTSALFCLRKSECYESFESKFYGGGGGGVDFSFSFESVPMPGRVSDRKARCGDDPGLSPLCDN